MTLERNTHRCRVVRGRKEQDVIKDASPRARELVSPRLGQRVKIWSLIAAADVQAIKINFSNSHHVPLIIFNVYAHPRKYRKALLFEQLLQKVEEKRCVNPTWDVLVTSDFNTNLIYTREPDDQLAAENAIWSVLPQFPLAQTRLDIRGKQLVEALEHLSMRVLNGRVTEDLPPKPTYYSAKSATTIDHTVVSLPLLAHVSKFEIKPKQ
ncbi:hypothetical protein NDU88_007548 [Pleurodeles waltl]|uniref:Endonuclease/exonuclease/phosphatase domain-containing protein n=1 Tax=Pleurodeles waltl TaxID=8319 RepID=A0AAV7N788_PLEWA|nr:hypothetical protein NDU88_007548 [Pleurodeles waltl]